MPSAPSVNDAPLAVRLKGRLDSGLFIWRQSGRLVVDRFDHIAAGGQLSQLGRNGVRYPMKPGANIVIYRETRTSLRKWKLQFSPACRTALLRRRL